MSAAGHLRAGLFRTLRRVLSGEPDSAFVFHPSARANLPAVGGPIDFYVHVPFCRARCTWCPYNTVPLDVRALPGFYRALLAEARLAAAAGASARGRSLYVGGGTPTCTGTHLVRFLRNFVSVCGRPASIAVETTPAELDVPLLDALLAAGVTQLSVGIQSFSPRILRALGRDGGSAADASRRLALAARAGFPNLNVDLMHDAGAATLDDLDRDIALAMESGADQITVYPLFRFYRGERVGMPRLRDRCAFHDRVGRRMEAAGYRPVSVWSYRRGGGGEAFSSVQRRVFAGLGPGAATALPGLFAFNTFDTAAWEERIAHGRCAWALEMPLSPNLRALYDLYWDLYALRLPAPLPIALRRRRLLAALAAVARGLRFARRDRLTARGACWIHLLQNHYILGYINRLWPHARNTPFPPALPL